MISLVSSVLRSKGLVTEKMERVEVVRGTTLVKRGFAHMLKHGVIMDVTNVEQAQIAEDAGAVAVMVLNKLPYDVRKAGGVARTASLEVIQETGKDVKVLCKLNEIVVAAEQHNSIDVVFHPELMNDTRLHQYFIEKAMEKKAN